MEKIARFRTKKLLEKLDRTPINLEREMGLDRIPQSDEVFFGYPSASNTKPHARFTKNTVNLISSNPFSQITIDGKENIVNVSSDDIVLEANRFFFNLSELNKEIFETIRGWVVKFKPVIQTEVAGDKPHSHNIKLEHQKIFLEKEKTMLKMISSVNRLRQKVTKI